MPSRTLLSTALAVALLPLAAGAQPTPAPTPRPQPGPPPAVFYEAPEAPDRPADRTYTFQIVLLAASVDGPARYENVPANAQKALADIKDFLPYKSYELLDLAWLRSSRRAEAQLSGPGGRTLSAALRFYSPESEPQRIEIQRLVVVEAPLLERLLIEAPRQGGAPTAAAPQAIRPLLETSFGMRSGETVVVGTSKLDGPTKALVVLLSALP